MVAMVTELSLLLLLGVTGALCGDVEVEGNGMQVKVLGQSGKIMLAPKDDSGESVSSHPDRVMIDMDSLEEVDSDGNGVGQATGHSFNTFANQDFSYSAVQDGEFQGIDVKYFTFQSTLKGMSAALEVTLYLFQENGTVTIDGEDHEVQAGSVKWTIAVDNWEWCDPCTKGNKQITGSALDFTIGIKGPGSPEASDGGETDDYTMGGAKLQLSKKVRVGGDWTDMASGFPKLSTQGSSTKFTFRFTKDGTKNFYYDPTLSYGAGANVIASVAVLMASVIAALFFKY